MSDQRVRGIGSSINLSWLEMAAEALAHYAAIAGAQAKAAGIVSQQGAADLEASCAYVMAAIAVVNIDPATRVTVNGINAVSQAIQLHGPPDGADSFFKRAKLQNPHPIPTEAKIMWIKSLWARRVVLCCAAAFYLPCLFIGTLIMGAWESILSAFSNVVAMADDFAAAWKTGSL